MILYQSLVSHGHLPRLSRSNLLLLVTLVFISANVAFGQVITFRQVNFTVPQTPQTTVALTYTSAQLAGSLNVVVVGWSSASVHVLSVRDSSGNTYIAPLAATVRGEAIQMFYAANIVPSAANTNTVTVTYD